MRNHFREQERDPLRCRRCWLHADLCACSLLQPMPTATRLLVIAHRLELRKSSNTGRLAVLCLDGAHLCVRGRRDGADDPVEWQPKTTPLFLFPCPDAMPLDEWKALHRPAPYSVTLIVPDGTWRQTKRVRRRVPELSDVQAVRLPPATSHYRLRKTGPNDRLATLEAIAYAFGILDGVPMQEHLLRVFQTVVDRTLWSNGRIAGNEVSGGVPPGARQDARLDEILRTTDHEIS